MSQRKHILVIDDDHSTLEILLLILQDAGFIVHISHDHKLDILQSGVNPDLILLDNNLGQKNGSEICKELKANTATQHIPVILISAMDDIRNIAQEACADDYIAKPFSIQVLVEKIRNALKAAC